MPSIQVKNVPADVHAVLRRRAALAGQSLQEYLLAWLTREARRSSNSELFARIEQHTGGKVSPAEAAEIIRELRGPL